MSGDLGPGLNMLASGLICAFRGGAGGGPRESRFFSIDELHDEQTQRRTSARIETTVRTDMLMFDSSKYDLEPNREPLSLRDGPDPMGSD